MNQQTKYPGQTSFKTDVIVPTQIQTDTYVLTECSTWTTQESLTSGQSNLTKDHIVPAHESFNRLQPENVSFNFFSKLNDSRDPIP